MTPADKLRGRSACADDSLTSLVVRKKQDAYEMEFGIFSNGFRPHTSATRSYEEDIYEIVLADQLHNPVFFWAIPVVSVLIGLFTVVMVYRELRRKAYERA